ncbi:hypothetical protein LCM20_05735 [Halobacillus litoralis]|uniref:hypothetical protein n=1 Tax=Halobacillus litoralis TaxID=45668 RepID=UPI001CD683D9|nr:hypothetical protein [Halobacillus litoralis]MCA0970078.1 hypothetical protein [Halobacillus litoralis]
MIYVITTLLSVSILLFILSFFMSSKMKQLEDQVEQLSMEMMQSNYQTSQKLKVLEEELLAEDLTGEIMKQQKPSSESVVDTIYSMYQKGYKPNYIARQTGLDEDDIHAFIEQWKSQGAHL